MFTRRSGFSKVGGYGTPNSFCAKSYDHLKLTQLHFPLNVCKFSTYGPCWSSVALVKEWLKGVLVDGYGLLIVI